MKGLCRNNFRRGSALKHCRYEGCSFHHPDPPDTPSHPLCCKKESPSKDCRNQRCYYFHYYSVHYKKKQPSKRRHSVCDKESDNQENKRLRVSRSVSIYEDNRVTETATTSRAHRSNSSSSRVDSGTSSSKSDLPEHFNRTVAFVDENENESLKPDNCGKQFKVGIVLLTSHFHEEHELLRIKEGELLVWVGEPCKSHVDCGYITCRNQLDDIGLIVILCK